MDFPVVGHGCLLLLFVLPFLAVAETKYNTSLGLSLLASDCSFSWKLPSGSWLLDFVHEQANYLVDKIPGKKIGI